jgi:hypothetical protein
VAGAAADHRAVVAEQRPCDDVFERDAEAGVEVAVGGGSREPVAQAQLVECPG